MKCSPPGRVMTARPDREDRMEIHGVPEPAASASSPENGARRDSSFFRRVLARIRRRRIPPSKFPIHRTLLPLAIALLGFFIYQFGERSLRPVQPGHVGVAVNRFTGSLEILPPGTHLRPRALYEIDVVRVSDRLLSGPPETSHLSKDCVARRSRPGPLGESTGLVLSSGRSPSLPGAISAGFSPSFPSSRALPVGKVSEKREELANSSSAGGAPS